MALQGFVPIKQPTKTKVNQFGGDYPVVSRSLQVRMTSKVPCLNTPALFSFGGEADLENLPLFIDKFFTNLCCFYPRFEENELVQSDLGTPVVF